MGVSIIFIAEVCNTANKLFYQEAPKSKAKRNLFT
jgi:hypothetical protein